MDVARTRCLSSPIGTATSEQLFQLTYSGVTNNVASPYLDYSTNQIYLRRLGRQDPSGHRRRTPTPRPSTCRTASRSRAARRSSSRRCSTTARSSPAAPTARCTGSDHGRHAVCVHRVGPGRRGHGHGRRRHVGADHRRHQQQDHLRREQLQRRRRARLRRLRSGVRGGRRSDVVHLHRRQPAPTIAAVPPTFDDAFWSTNNGSLYASGSNTAGTATYLVRVAYNAGAMGAITGNAALAHTGTRRRRRHQPGHGVPDGRRQPIPTTSSSAAPPAPTSS